MREVSNSASIEHWFHLYRDEADMGAAHPLRWTGHDQTWNYQCADCHSAKLDKHTPADRDVLLALVTMNRDAGNLDDARSYAQALRLRYPDDPEIAALSHTLLQGETIRVNGRPPRPEERTTLQVVDGMLRGNRVIAWVFERNGARAGRGAMTWKMAEPGLLIGRWQTTFYSGTAVLARAPDVASAPHHGSDHD